VPAAALHSVADARQRARRVLPRVVFDYVDGGAEDEVTMAENERAFRELAFRPRMAVGVAEPDLGTTVLGTELSFPVLLAPCGLVRLLHPDGAAGAGRAAAGRGTIWVLSTVAGATLESVADAGGHRWFQLYAPGGRDEAATMLERAESAGYEALVVTVDTPALGNRERDVRNGVAPPLRLDARTAIALGPQVLARPRWALRMMRDGVSLFGRPRPAGGGDLAKRDNGIGAAGAVSMLASPFSWDDVAWIRQRWTRPLVVKGVLSAEDARLAAGAGADAVVVSNHGGRQLDGAPATARVLPEVVAAVGGQTEVLVDGGIRRGGDVLKALALGARAVLVGRAYLYGLAAAGQGGVEQILDALRSEMTRDMRLLGCSSVAELDASWLRLP
jgi:isopentenyl diphosphate isomerase/L-lactate dehydrogenase-like FMN-dependent dehydrogenase